MIDGAFFVGRKEIMDWINQTLDLNLAKVEDTANGCIACQLLDIMYPGQVPMSKLNWSAKQDFEFVANYKILQTCFSKLNIDRFVDVDRLISGRYMDNLEFMQWFKRFFEMSVSEKPADYDAYGQRCKGKGLFSDDDECCYTLLMITCLIKAELRSTVARKRVQVANLVRGLDDCEIANSY